MEANDILILIFLIPILFLIIRVRKKLHWVEPWTRLKIAVGMLFGSTFLFLGTLKFLPRPPEAEIELFHQAVLIALMTGIAGGVVLSTLLLSSSGLQLLKRWRYHHRNGS